MDGSPATATTSSGERRSPATSGTERAAGVPPLSPPVSLQGGIVPSPSERPSFTGPFTLVPRYLVPCHSTTAAHDAALDLLELGSVCSRPPELDGACAPPPRVTI